MRSAKCKNHVIRTTPHDNDKKPEDLFPNKCTMMVHNTHWLALVEKRQHATYTIIQPDHGTWYQSYYNIACVINFARENRDTGSSCNGVPVLWHSPCRWTLLCFARQHHWIAGSSFYSWWLDKIAIAVNLLCDNREGTRAEGMPCYQVGYSFWL